MSETVELFMGGRQLSLTRSDTEVAVKPAPGLARSLEGALGGVERRQPVARRGRIGGYEIVDIRASAAEVLAERARLRSAPSVGAEMPVYHTSDDDVPFVPEGTILLSFSDGASEERKQEIVEAYQLELLRADRDGFLTVRPTERSADPVEIAAALQQVPEIEVAEPDLVTPKQLAEFRLPTDELLARQWHLENKGEHNGIKVGYKKGADARVIAAWKAMDSLGSPAAIIAIIDDGFDLLHPDLAGKAVHPWDFVRNSEDVSPETDHLPDHRAGDWHGTACAGVAAASSGAGQIVGVAPNARIMPVRTGDLSATAIERWFNWVTDHGAWVVSCSWGAAANKFPLPLRVSRAIERCAREGREGKGAPVVFAAGNNKRSINDGDYLNGFAVHPDVIAVSASTSRDRWADYSNFGNEICVCAPSGGGGSWGLVTCDVQGSYIDADGIRRNSGYDDGDYHTSFWGTSAGCPLVAGVCALVLSANPALTSKEVREILQKTARRIGSDHEYGPNGHSHRYGYGCVNADAAVQEALRRVPIV